MGGVSERDRREIRRAFLRGVARGVAKSLPIATLGLLATLAAILLSGCETTRYVPVETVKWRDSVRLVERVDSIHVHDSVYVHQWREGDTEYVERVTVHTRYRDRWRADTVIVHRRDSVPYPVEVAKEVVKYRLRWWQKPLLWLGGLSLFGIAVWWIVRARKRA